MMLSILFSFFSASQVDAQMCQGVSGQKWDYVNNNSANDVKITLVPDAEAAKIARNIKAGVEYTTTTDMAFTMRRDDSSHRSYVKYIRMDNGNQETFVFNGGYADHTRLELSNDQPTRQGAYKHLHQGCVNGHNLVKYTDKSISECVRLCDARDDCDAFEYGVAHGGSGGYKAKDCQLQSSAKFENCDGAHHNLDLYIKTGGYRHVQKGCVGGHNLVKYTNKSVMECVRLCDARDDCLAFEYGVAYGGSGAYKAKDCQLQSGANFQGCDGSHHNLDLYIKPDKSCGYEHRKKGCVNGANIVKHTRKSVEECATLCDAMDACLAFEYGVTYGGKGGYVAGDCQLQSSSKYAGCDGGHHNLDLYVKKTGETCYGPGSSSGRRTSIKCIGPSNKRNYQCKNLPLDKEVDVIITELFLDPRGGSAHGNDWNRNRFTLTGTKYQVCLVKSTTPEPTALPTERPTTPNPTPVPTERPTTPNPTSVPTERPTTPEPTAMPTDRPTTSKPTVMPTKTPSAMPTVMPTKTPTTPEPTALPTQKPTTPAPTARQTETPEYVGCYVENSGSYARQSSPQWCSSMEECQCPSEFPYVGYTNGNTGWASGAEWSCFKELPPTKTTGCITRGYWHVGARGWKTSIYRNPACTAAVGYKHVHQGCVNGHNLVKYTDKSVMECARMCDARDDCDAFEYGVAHGGSGSYKAKDCQLQSSAKLENCDGAHHNLDLYIKTGSYKHVHQGCVNGHNLVKYTDKTITECARLCDDSAVRCVAFEYGVAHGGKGSYKAKDCQLQSSAKFENCDGAHHNLDLYIRTEPPTAPTPATTAEPTPATTAEPIPATPGYKHVYQGCVNGANLVKYTDKSVMECARLCDAQDDCDAFEYGVAHGGSGGYKAKDCQLQSSAKFDNCDGAHHNLDLYIKTGDYKHVHQGCVNGHNLVKYTDKSITECVRLCDARDDCHAFEYGVAHGGSGGYKAKDCQLQSSAKFENCDGAHHNLDLYIKTEKSAAPTPATTAEPTPATTAEPAPATPGYKHVHQGCVNGANLVKFTDKSVMECARLCDARDDCHAFEYGVAHGGSGGYKVKDCQLQSSAKFENCDGAHHNLDLYIKTGDYEHMHQGCVNGHNLVKYTDKSISECKWLCDARADCHAFEYGVAHGGSGSYKAKDCQLQSSAKFENCDGAHHNLDLYIKTEPSAAPAPATTAEPTDATTAEPTPSTPGYKHLHQGCVNGANLVKYTDKSVMECARLCDARDDCDAFEYGVAHGGSGGYKAKDCQLQSSGNFHHCDGAHHNLDLYIKTELYMKAAGYKHIQKGCVGGHNLVKYTNKSVMECVRLCDARDDCHAFEYGVAYGGSGGYKAKDCQLQSSAKFENCDGAHHNLDLYIKTEPPTAPTPATTAEPSPATPGYKHLHQGCVNGANLVKYTDKSVMECARLCDARDDCHAFEYGVAYGGNGGYKAKDCQLQSSAKFENCDGAHHNLDLYVKTGGYEHMHQGCVNGHNLVKYTDKTITECVRLCDARDDCLAFEYGVAHGGKGSYKAKDCQLQSSAKFENCDGAHHNLDLYIKTRSSGAPTAIPTLLPTARPTQKPTTLEPAELPAEKPTTPEPTAMPPQKPISKPTAMPTDVHCIDKYGRRFVNRCVLDMFAADPKQNICGPCGCSGCPLIVPDEAPAEAPKPTSFAPTLAPTRSPTEGPVETTKRPPEKPTKPEPVCLDFVKAKDCKKKAKKKGLKCKWSKKKKLCTAKTKKTKNKKDKKTKNKAD